VPFKTLFYLKKIENGILSRVLIYPSDLIYAKLYGNQFSKKLKKPFFLKAAEEISRLKFTKKSFAKTFKSADSYDFIFLQKFHFRKI